MIYQALEDENADLFCLQTSVSQVIVFIVNFKVGNIIFINIMKRMTAHHLHPCHHQIVLGAD